MSPSIHRQGLIIAAAITSASIIAVVAAPTLALVPATAPSLGIRATSGAPAIVLERSTDLVGWRPQEIATNGTGTVRFEADPTGFQGYFLRVRDAAADETPAPLRVTATSDGDFVRRALITSDGGTLTLTDDNLTVYELTIPPRALPGFADVTMKVVGPVGGLTLAGGLLGAVTIEPADLQLRVPATLKVTAAKAVPGPVPVGFRWRATDGELHLVPVSVASRTATFVSAGLGNFGVGGTDIAGFTALSKRVPSTVRDQSEHGLALVVSGTAVSAARRSPRPQFTDAGLALVLQRLRARWEADVMNALNEALGNDDLLDSALHTLLDWHAAVVLTSIEDPRVEAGLSAETKAALERGHDAVIRSIEESRLRCLGHDLTRIARLISAGHWAETPLLAPAFTDGERGLYRKFVKECASFEFEMDSDYVYDIKALGKAHSRVKTLIPVHMEIDAAGALKTLKGSGVVRVTEAELTSNAVPLPCSFSEAVMVGGNGSIDAVDFGVDLTSKDGRAALKLTVLFNPFLPAPEDTYKVACPFLTAPIQYTLWPAFFGTAHADEIVRTPLGQVLKVAGWTIHKGDESIATLDDISDVIASPGHGNEVTRFTLHHTPGL